MPEPRPEPDVIVPEGDPKKGLKIFKSKCAQCHSVAKNAATKTGPSLFNVVGSPAGQKEYDYSVGMKESGIIWSPKHLFVYLENPKKYVTGTKMVFAGMKSEKEKSHLIAYLKEQK